MKQCPTCKRELKDNLFFCPYDGGALIEIVNKVDSLVGLLLDDKYRLEHMIGKGGMGTVYRATHIQMENVVAVKVLHPHLASDRLAVERFRREARAAAQIRHPNAVAVTDFGVTRDEEVAYLVMEFLEGEDLRSRMREEAQLSYKETSQVLSQVCSAVHAAHIKGIIHRDLKPDNIWLLKTEDNADRIKVLDFGIAKLKASAEGSTLTQKGMIVGTPYYMSPEQCRGEELDAGSDIYSLGVILYEMLTGKVPFEGSTPLAVVLKHNSENPKPLRVLRPNIPAQIEKVVLRALSKARKDRQVSAIELAEEFERVASGATDSIMSNEETAASPSTVAVKSYLAQGQENQPSQVQRSVTRAYDRNLNLASGLAAKPEHKISDSPDPIHPAAESDLTAAADPVPAGAVAPLASDAYSLSNSTGTGSLSKRAKTLIAIIAVTLSVAVIFWIALPRSSPVTDGAKTTDAPPPTSSPVPEGMTLIRGGIFVMGTNDPKARAEWKPEHTVPVADFYIDVSEVTNEEYYRFVKQTGHPTPPHWKDGVYPPGESKLPVYNVSWYDAKAYADSAGKRLPTEAEWEYAARGKDGRVYPWGDQWNEQFSNSKEDGRGKPVAVGSYRRGDSPFGVADLAGNVSEWVAEDYVPYPGSSAKPDPGFKIYRGGSYIHYQSESTTFARWADVASAKFPYIGFRCAKDGPK